MRKINDWLLPAFSLFLLAACNSDKKSSISFEVENPGKDPRNSALVLLSREEISKKANGKTADWYEVMAGDNIISSQLDDLDGDGRWDELAFLYDFKAGEKLSVQLLRKESAPSNASVAKAHVRHMRKLENNSFGPSLTTDSIDGTQQATDFNKQKLPPFLTEGPAWENDRVGFRLYFDVRNGKDIWGKLIKNMVLDDVGRDSASNYHALDEWGMDLLKVGSSLGAGALAVWIPSLNGKDSLVRVGGANVGTTVYEQVADGPVRAIFRIHYKNWNLHPSIEPLSITEEIQIWGGQLFYDSKLTVQSLPPNASLVTGIVNLHNAEKYEVSEGEGVVLYTHHLQSENKDRLGMAVMLAKNELKEFDTPQNADTDIRNTYLVKMISANNQSNKFRFYAAWEKSEPSLAERNNFENYLREQLREYVQPLIIR